MKLFCNRLAWFLLPQILAFAACGLFYLAAARRSTHHLIASKDKNLLLRELPSPRLILLGGSATGCGIDSAMLEKRFSRSTLNMGLQYSLGLNLMLNEAEAEMKPGDFFVICPEYHQFFETLNGNGNDLAELLEYNPSSIRYFSAPSLRLLLDASLQRCGHMLRQAVITLRTEGVSAAMRPKIFHSVSFNQYGDATNHHGKARPARFETVSARVDSDMLDQAVRRMNKFNAACREKGAQAALVFPPLPEDQYAANREAIEFIHGALRHELDFPLLDAPAEEARPMEFFYDTAYHLTAEGAQLRTAHLIEKLVPLLNNGQR